MYPAFLNLREKTCVVIGGGKVAERKIKGILNYGRGEIILISPSATQEIHKLAKDGKVKLLKRKYSYGMIPEHASLVFECTGNPDISRLVRKECSEKKIFLNSATLPELSDFFVPSSLKKGDIVVSVSTSGKCSAFAKALREKLEENISPLLSYKLNIIEKIREKLMSYGRKSSDEDKFLLEISRWAVENQEVGEDEFITFVKRKAEEMKINLEFP